jgi:ankyrin repeat protein
MEKNVEISSDSKLARALSIIGLFIGLLALPAAGISTFAPLLGGILPLDLLTPFAVLVTRARYISYGAEALALSLGLGAVILAFAKKASKVFPVVTVFIALISIGITVAGRSMKAPSMAAGIDPRQVETMTKYLSRLKIQPTPLMEAAEAGRTEEVRALLRGGASPYETSLSGSSACGLAVKNGYLATVKAFLEEDSAFKKDKENLGELLRVAVDNNRVEIVRLLIEHDAEIDTMDLAGDDWTSLMYAAYNGHEEIADILIENGAQIDARNAGDGTPLMLAAGSGRRRIVEKLLDAGADIEAKTVDGQTALITACMGGDAEVVKLLISRGADMNARDSYRHTAMQWAAHEGHIDLVRLLQQAGARE